jgi:hypothetical protein
MPKLLTTAALATVLLSGVAHAGDYTDRSEYTCDKDTVEAGMSSMIANGPGGKLGVKVIYIKDVTEVSRNKTELKCRLTVVTNINTMKGTFRFHEQDGHSLIAWQAGK